MIGRNRVLELARLLLN